MISWKRVPDLNSNERYPNNQQNPIVVDNEKNNRNCSLTFSEEDEDDGDGRVGAVEGEGERERGFRKLFGDFEYVIGVESLELGVPWLIKEGIGADPATWCCEVLGELVITWGGLSIIGVDWGEVCVLDGGGIVVEVLEEEEEEEKVERISVNIAKKSTTFILFVIRPGRKKKQNWRRDSSK